MAGGRSAPSGGSSTYRLAGLVALLITSITALVTCPHSKVEESFNLQATHDLFYHGITPAISAWWNGHDVTDSLPYDHLQYPGVVPRTFTGPLILAYACQLIGILLSPIYDLAAHPMTVQALSRFLLLIFNIHALYRLAVAADGRFAPIQSRRRPLVGGYLLLITAVQFHLPFYSSRMLPNTFALGLVVHGYADWIGGKTRKAAAWLVAAAAIFRCDVLILLFTVGLTMLIRREMTIGQAITTGIAIGTISLVTTVPLDSLLWRRLLWPEGEVLFFNTVENKSSDWGTSPWHWYFTSALPKALLTTSLLVPLSVLKLPEMIGQMRHARKTSNTIPSYSYADRRIWPFLLPVVAFVALYSKLPHKEMRFIFPSLPILNLAAAVGLTHLHGAAFPVYDKVKDEGKQLKNQNRSRILKYLNIFLFLGGIGCVAVAFVGSSAFLAVSAKNYPGGDALTLLQTHIKQSGGNEMIVSVHIDVASAMSGVSLFGQRASGYSFSKSGYETNNEYEASALRDYTHLLSETGVVTGFHVVGASQGNPKFDLRQRKIMTTDAIFVLEREH